MSLTTFLALPDVIAKLKPLRPKVKKHGLPLKVPSRNKHYSLVGTAFDYLIRFELQRRMPHAIAQRWVAESTPEIVHSEYFSDGKLPDLLLGARPDLYMPPAMVAGRMRLLLQNARSAVKTYIQEKYPTTTQQAELAAHAIRLAKLDIVFRALILDPKFEDADADDVRELVELLAIVPYEDFMTALPVFLNPTFGNVSALLGGADADLITGDVLIELKTTINDAVKSEYLDQLFGYYLLLRRHRITVPTFPPIKRLGIYLSRHGHLLTLDTSTWTNHSEFLAVEQWFFRRAEEVRSSLKAQFTPTAGAE